MFDLARIDFDLNDVIMDNKTAIILASGDRLNENHFTGWDAPFGEALGMTNVMAQEWAYQNPELQMAALPNIGAREAMAELRQRGIVVNVVTATILEIDQIAEWLDRHDIVVDEIVKSSNKVSPTLLIDDSKETAEMRWRLGLKTLVFDQRWNRTAPGPRVNSLAELPSVLEVYRNE